MKTLFCHREVQHRGSTSTGEVGQLFVEVVSILFLYSIVRWSTTIVTFVTFATFATFVLRVAQGHYLYGLGGLVFMLFYITHSHIHTYTDIFYTGGTGVYLYGGRGMSPLPPAC
jgi:hypothetical protein